MDTNKKLKKVNPVSLILTYENGHIIEFNIETLVGMSTSFGGGIIGGKGTHLLEITLEYSEELSYNQKKQPVLAEQIGDNNSGH